MDKPQIILHVQKPVSYTLYEARWIPCSAKFVSLGSYARGTGAFQIYEVTHGDVKVIQDVSIRPSKMPSLFVSCDNCTVSWQENVTAN